MGLFQDESLISGLAASEDGRYEAGMGIDAADVDGDGFLDVYITHLDIELNRLYHNNGDGTFTDVTYSSGIGNKAMMLSGVAAKFIDYDNDGWPDIVQANGAMVDNVELYHSEVSYKEPLLMFHNLGAATSKRFPTRLVQTSSSRWQAAAWRQRTSSTTARSASQWFQGDFPELLRNDGGNANHWLEVLLIGTKSNRDGIGSALKLTSEGSFTCEQSKGGTS